MAKDTKNVNKFHEIRYWSCADWCIGTYCGAKDNFGLAPQRDTYKIDDQQLVIEKWSGWSCCAATQKDYTDLKNIVDADLASTPPPLKHMMCCGSRKDVVTITTSSGSGGEKKELHVATGEGEKIQKVVMRR